LQAILCAREDSNLESAYRAGAGLAGWDIEDLTSNWCPDWLPRLLGD